MNKANKNKQKKDKEDKAASFIDTLEESDRVYATSKKPKDTSPGSAGGGSTEGP